ncbi:hypothetical protein EMIT0P258_80271 [Pseudomonas sp. IT-P258]
MRSSLATNYFQTSSVLIGEWNRAAAPVTTALPMPCAVGEDRVLRALDQGATSENRFQLQAEFRQETS